MNHLLRELAPLSSRAWSRIEEEAKAALETTLAGRRFVDFEGPLGWDAHAVDLGRVTELEETPAPGVRARRRQAQPLVELRVPFALPREKIEDLARGARGVNLDEVVEAARTIALAEDAAVFDGFPAGGIDGILTASPHGPVTLDANYEHYPKAVGEALLRLREEGVGGPFGIALGSRCHKGLTTTTSGGYPVMEHVRRMVDGPIVWAPGIDGACVLSTRGGDYELVVGEDYSLGYASADDRAVELYIEESLTFRNLEPAAAVPLRYRDA